MFQLLEIATNWDQNIVMVGKKKDISEEDCLIKAKNNMVVDAIKIMRNEQDLQEANKETKTKQELITNPIGR